MIAHLVPLASSEAHEGGGVNPWIVGISVFVLLLVMLAGLVFFGNGREHS